MALLTTNGMSVDDLTAAPNGPGLAQQLGNQVDLFYGPTVANVAALPATGKFPGQRIWVTDIETHAVWNPTAAMWDGYWKSITLTVTNMPATVSASWLRVGKAVSVEFTITATGAATNVILLSKPTSSAYVTPDRSLGTAMGVDGGASATRRSITVVNNSATDVFFIADSLTSAATAAQTVPWTWASTDTLGGRFDYQEAA